MNYYSHDCKNEYPVVVKLVATRCCSLQNTPTVSDLYTDGARTGGLYTYFAYLKAHGSQHT